MQTHELEPTSKAQSHPPARAVERQEEVVPLPQFDPLAQVISQSGSDASAPERASLLSRAAHPRASQVQPSVLQLQRQYGNRYVQRMVALARKADGESEVAPEVEDAIQRERGGGQADALNRDLSARAFTTGQDIFFRHGEYSPGSSSGRELLAHELTHVVQQGGDRVKGKLTVGAPDDRYEQEADRTAVRVMSRISRAPEEEEKKEEPLQAKRDEMPAHRLVGE